MRVAESVQVRRRFAWTDAANDGAGGVEHHELVGIGELLTKGVFVHVRFGDVHAT